MNFFEGHIDWITENKFISQGLIILVVFLSSIYGGMIWNGIYWVQIAFLVVVALFIGFSFFDKNRDLYAKLPRMEIEWAIVVSVMVIISSWILSPVPRQGLWRVSSIIAYFCLFYLLIDLLLNGMKPKRLLFAFFIVVGLYLFSAVLEVYLAYQQWFASVASNEIYPPTIYRFSSLLGHSNALMAAANLLAPIGIVLLIQTKQKATKIALMFWYVLYILAIPFSSSRGGFVGIAMWGAVLFGYILFFHKTPFLEKNRKKIVISTMILGIIAFVLVLIFGGYLVSHPSHGKNLFSTREIMWGDALLIFQNHVWFGAGPGRVPFEILNVDSFIPPRYFPNHVHNTWLQIMAEFGLMGVLSFALISGFGIRMLIRQWKSLAETTKLLGISYMASFCGFFFHSILDDFSNWVLIIIIFIGLLAIFMTMQPEKVKVWREINVRAIFIPIGILLCAGVYSIWAQYPFRTAVELYDKGEYKQAANMISRSIENDINNSYLYTEAGLAWAKVWGETSDELALEFARSYLRQSLEIEESPSFIWADLAVLDWYAGDHVIALEHIRKAISISDQESSHYLMYGYFLELMNENNDALNAYQSAIALAPGSCSHPFWQGSNLRTNFSCDIETGILRSKHSLTYFNEAISFIDEMEYHQAQVAIQNAKWVGEPSITVDVANLNLAEAMNDEGADPASIEALIENDFVFDNYVYQPLHHLIFSRWIYRSKGLDYILVPGYMQIMPNYGQFEIAEKYLMVTNIDNNPDSIKRLREIYQSAMFAGALDSSTE